MPLLFELVSHDITHHSARIGSNWLELARIGGIWTNYSDLPINASTVRSNFICKKFSVNEWEDAKTVDREFG